MGTLSILGNLAGGFTEEAERAAERKIRENETTMRGEMSRRREAASMLGQLAGDENVRPEVAARAFQAWMALYQTPLEKKAKFPKMEDIFSPERQGELPGGVGGGVGGQPGSIAPFAPPPGAGRIARPEDLPPDAGQLQQLQPSPERVQQMPIPRPPPGYQTQATDIFLTPAEQRQRRARDVESGAYAQRRGALRAAREFPAPPEPTTKQRDFGFLRKALGDDDKARRLAFGVLPGEKVSAEDKAVFTDESNNRVAVFFSPDGVQKRVVLGKVSGPGGIGDATAAQRNYASLIKQGLDPKAARQLAFGLTTEERDRVSPAEFAQRILQFTRWSYFSTDERSIKRALAFVNQGLPPDQQITPEDLARMMASARPGLTPPPGGAAPTGQHKIGDTVTYQGRPHKVTAINPDGTLSLEPVQR